jgi:hypothetical protein
VEDGWVFNKTLATLPNTVNKHRYKIMKIFIKFPLRANDGGMTMDGVMEVTVKG